MASSNELRKEHLDIVAQAKGITDGARQAVRGLTDDEKKSLDDLLAKADHLTTAIKAAEADEARLKAVGELFGGSDNPVTPGEPEARPEGGVKARSMGEKFVKSMQSKGLSLKGAVREGFGVKANTDTHVTGGQEGFWYDPWLLETDTSNPVRPLREQPVVGDLISWGTMSGTALRYLVYPPTLLEGSAGMVNEGGTKPQVHITEPAWHTDALSEVAAWFKVTDDMAEDLPFVMSEIDRQLQYNFTEVMSAQLLRGDGNQPNIQGILNRSGVQHLPTSGGAAGMADDLFRALQSVQTATGFAADGIVINPADYQALRLMKDSNGQYFAGGIFGGNYGSTGQLNWQPPLWGVRTVVSTSAAVGQPIVGAWKAGATGYRKGGLIVESTNSHENDFTNDRITIRMRTKLGLAVRYPGAFVALDA